MSDILNEIVKHRKRDVEKQKSIISIQSLEHMPFFNAPCFSLKEAIKLCAVNPIIAEFKRASPSKGNINLLADCLHTVQGYQNAGAVAISILTETVYFKGSTDDLYQAAKTKTVPLLRKDFIVDAYQIVEAKAMGADVVLLIASCLTPNMVKSLSVIAKSLGLEVLLEIHDEKELEHICTNVDFVGVNNRNLKTFDVDTNNSIKLCKQIPSNLIKIAESGIDSPQTLLELKKEGFNAFLIGEALMKKSSPSNELKKYVNVADSN
jgi:indole-3-glycerol phosphate synthase